VNRARISRRVGVPSSVFYHLHRAVGSVQGCNLAIL
jgi:hypothetical protein